MTDHEEKLIKDLEKFRDGFIKNGPVYRLMQEDIDYIKRLIAEKGLAERYIKELENKIKSFNEKEAL